VPYELLGLFAVAFVVATAATPMAARLARLTGVVDQPGERRVNLRENIPLLGGLAVALGASVGFALLRHELSLSVPEQRRLEGLLIGGILLLGVGVWDDRFGMRARNKLLVQVVAACVAIHFGFQIDHFRDPVLQQNWQLTGWAMVLITIVWIVGITNAINLIDGLDGLATGIAAIITATLTYVCWQFDQTLGLFVGVALLGGLAGFLPFNFPPASLFLGDAGSLFIGYTLALLAIEGSSGQSVLTFVVPLLALAVPILDTGLSIIRRLRRGEHVFSPDKQHMHHRLLESEGSHRSAVLSLYFVTGCFCVIAISFTKLAGYAAIFFFITVVILTVRMLRNLGLLHSDEDESEPDSSPAEAAETSSTDDEPQN
jgi:UDP-GlcNAc:undecaprenyl-phosphate GlcNAc-1-phosphate transferase